MHIRKPTKDAIEKGGEGALPNHALVMKAGKLQRPHKQQTQVFSEALPARLNSVVAAPQHLHRKPKRIRGRVACRGAEPTNEQQYGVAPTQSCYSFLLPLSPGSLLFLQCHAENG